MPILVVNAGSSSLKLSLIGDHDRTLAERELPAPDATVDPAELEQTLTTALRGAEAVAHRIVHGGERYRHAVVIDASVLDDLRRLTDLAPLHRPNSLAMATRPPPWAALTAWGSPAVSESTLPLSARGPPPGWTSSGSASTNPPTWPAPETWS